jgi:KDO2-lipid IV(A) lauroyltransferase
MLAEYAGLRLGAGIVSLLPEWAAWHFGKALGWLIHIIDGRHRLVASGNLAAAFPEKTPGEIKELVRKVFEHIGLVVVESLRIGKMLEKGIENFVEKPDMSEVHKIIGEGKGMIVATAHIGNWEVAGHATSVMITPLSSVARPMDNPLVEEYVDRMRRMSGQAIIGKRGAVRDMLRVLRSGGAVVILMDQDARRHGIFADFFGRPASTWPSAAALSLKLGCPIAFGFVRRIGRFRYKLIFDEMFLPEPTGDREADVQQLTQRITSRLEERIRECPEQWFWVHRRWKTQPAEPAEDQAP